MSPQPTRSEDFDDGVYLSTLRTEGFPPHEIEIVSPKFGARSGSRCHRLKWYSAYYAGTRATRSVEGLSGSGSQNPRMTTEGWYGFSFYMASGDFPTNRGCIIAQVPCWHSSVPNTDKTLVLGTQSDGSLQWSAYYGVGDGGATQTANYIVWPAGTIQNNFNRWHDCVVYVKFSNTGNGILRIWYNNNSPTSPNFQATNIMFGNGAWTSPDLMTHGAYVKWGVYAWDTNNITIPSTETRQIYFDEIAYMVGNPEESFESVRPGYKNAQYSLIGLQ